MSSRQLSRGRAIRAVRSILIDHPLEDLSLQALADLAGVSLWVLRGHFGNIETVFRAVGTHMIDEAEAELCFTASDEDGVIDTIRNYAGFLRGVMRSSNYRDLVYLVLRNGQRHRWLGRAYERRILGKTDRDLSDLVLRAGERLGAPILLKAGATRRLHRRAEAEFVWSTLLPPYESRSDKEAEAILKDIVHEAFAATYSFEWQSATAA